MKNQFFYTTKEGALCSFNMNKVIRTVTLEDKRLLVLLDDLHQRPIEVDVKNKQGKVTAIKREMQVFQSEIYLTEKNDINNFYTLTNVAL